jgi:NAD(P)H dehydrogenase (quinone)
MTKVAIVYYSLYGHVRSLALGIKEGLEAGGATVHLLQVPETLPEEVLKKMGAPPKTDDPIATASALAEYDGIIFGISARYGREGAQIRSFLDSTGGLWMGGKLVGKPGAVFASTANQGGGQETASYGMVQFMAHHGMVYVSLGYRDPKVFNNEEAHGGSPFGAGTLANGDGSRQPSPLEMGVAETQGKSFAEIVAKLSA